MAVAALAIVAVAAAMLLAGGNPAQATTAENLTPASSGGHLLPMATDPTPTPTPTHATPEPCPQTLRWPPRSIPGTSPCSTYGGTTTRGS